MYSLSSVIAWVAAVVLKYRAKVIETNLSKSFPDGTLESRSHTARAFYLSLSDLIVECIKTLSISPASLRKKVTVSNAWLCDEAVKKHGGAIVLAGHQANWEWTLLGGADALQVPVIGVYKPLHNRFFDNLMKNIRSRTGAKLVASDDLIRYVGSTAYQPSALALVADQTPQLKGARISRFLNQPTLFFRGPEFLYRKTGWPVLFIENVRVSRGVYQINFHLLLNPGEAYEEIIPRYATVLEESIDRHPEQWLWSHRRWKHKIISDS